jgi:septal ring factor EnvC (AmiA/AmiB activator)
MSRRWVGLPLCCALLGCALLGYALLGGALLTAGRSLSAAEEQTDLESLEMSISQDREKAEDLSARTQALEEEIRSLQVSFTGMLRKIRHHEQAIDSAEEALAGLEAEKAIRLEEMARRREDFYGTLAALQRIAFRPRAAMLAAEHPPIDTLRGALLLSAALPEIEGRARTVESFLAELQTLTRSIEEERQALDSAAATLQQERARLSELIDRKQAALSVTEAEKQAAEARAAELASKAENLRQLMALATEEAEAAQPAPADDPGSTGEAETAEPSTPSRPQLAARTLEAPSPVRFLAENQAQLLMPVDGPIVARFGQNIARGPNAGQPAKGLTIRGKAAALVVAPFDGKVVYAGAFRSYGQILIIDHGGRYHTLLAGLHEISATVGQWVLAGEPIATMSPLDNQRPELYLELRRTGEAIDPLPWLADIDSKVRG